MTGVQTCALPIYYVPSSDDSWHELIDVYGKLRDGTSQIRLQLSVDYDETIGDTSRTELVGTIAYHPSNDSLLLFTVDGDTVPANTLSPVNAIINPYNITVDSQYLNPSAGARYLILDSIRPGSQLWGNLTANANDIIQFDGTQWTVSFNSESHSNIEYVTNLNTTVQYKWSQGSWTKSVEGVYREGEWSIIL